jgi:hypothetical protein
MLISIAGNPLKSTVPVFTMYVHRVPAEGLARLELETLLGSLREMNPDLDSRESESRQLRPSRYFRFVDATRERIW